MCAVLRYHEWTAFGKLLLPAQRSSRGGEGEGAGDGEGGGLRRLALEELGFQWMCDAQRWEQKRAARVVRKLQRPAAATAMQERSSKVRGV